MISANFFREKADINTVQRIHKQPSLCQCFQDEGHGYLHQKEPLPWHTTLPWQPSYREGVLSEVSRDFDVWQPQSPGLFTLTIFVKKAYHTIGSSIGPSPVLPSALITSFILIVRPSLEYGSVTCHPLDTTLTNCLQACQRFVTRVILQSWNLSQEDLLQKSDLPLLSKRRDYATLCHLFKIPHHLSSSPNP